MAWSATLRAAAVGLAIGLVGCSDPAHKVVLGPDLPTGNGRSYAVREQTFTTVDGVRVSALVAQGSAAAGQPAVVLLHDLSNTKETWLSGTSLFVDLLAKGYTVAAIDLRGFGTTPLPQGRQVAVVADLDSSYRDVEAAIDWLGRQPAVDPARIALVGIGSGANIAYVATGIMPSRVKAAVVVSAGLWESGTLKSVVVGTGWAGFAPRGVLYLAGANDTVTAGTRTLSYADLARTLAAATAEPKSVLVVAGSADHGVDLLNNAAEAMPAVLSWLGDRL